MVCVRLLKQHVHYSNYKTGWGETLDHSPRSLSLTPFSHSTNCLSAFVLFEKAETTETKCADFVPLKEREKQRESGRVSVLAQLRFAESSARQLECEAKAN